MRYSGFTITNFKGIRSLTIDLSRPPRATTFALVGLNESGKTTILEAIHWFYSPTTYDHVSLIPKSELLNFNGEITVRVSLDLSDSDREAIARHLREASRFHLTEPIGQITSTRTAKYENSTHVTTSLTFDITATGRRPKARSPQPLRRTDEAYSRLEAFLSDRLLPSITYYQNFLFDFPDKLYLGPKPSQSLSPQDLFYKNVIQDVMNSMGRDLAVERHLVARFTSASSADRAALGSTLDKLASKITTQVFTAWRELLKFAGTGLSITLGDTLRDDDKGYYLQVQVKEGDQTYLIRERSLGFRWFFSFVLFTYFRAYRDRHRTDALFLLDEPASNLHQTAQAKILSAFGNFPHNQDVIYATHSHHMINPKWLAATYVVKNEAKEYKEIDVAYNSYMTNIVAERYFSFVAHHPHDTDYYRPILEVLDYQPSQLELVPSLTMVEGKNDYYALRYMAELILPSQETSLHIYPGAGKDKLDLIVGLYLAWGREFLVLLDDDIGGRRTAARLKKEFGPLLDERLFTLRDVSPDWRGFSTEDLFTEPDTKKVIAVTYPGEPRYDKARFNVALQECFITTRRISFQRATTRRFEKLRAFLSAHLSSQESASPGSG